MAYFWRCPVCDRLYTFADDEDPVCNDHPEETEPKEGS